jgi:gluconokinase
MIVLVMGVSGVGKSTIGPALAAQLGWPCLDADDYHPPENVAKMAKGIALEDADRWPWLARINEELRKLQSRGKSGVLCCSALKESYRAALRAGIEDFRVVYLHGSPELIQRRIAGRKHRYMPASLLDSQLATLEPPSGAVELNVAHSVEHNVAQAAASLQA